MPHHLLTNLQDRLTHLANINCKLTMLTTVIKNIIVALMDVNQFCENIAMLTDALIGD